jgi:hypothetical protein
VDEDALAALIYSHLLETLQLALRATVMIEPPTENTLRELRELQQAVEDVEVSTAMLLNRSGVSWEQMAMILGVKRQSLNRRLSRKVVQLEGSRPTISSLERDWAAALSGLKNEVESLTKSKSRQTAYIRAREILANKQ